MRDQTIIAVDARDVRFPLPQGTGTDAVHSGADYAFATTLLTTDAKNFGTGIVLTLGNGNQLVCRAIEILGQKLIGWDVEELMSKFGEISRQLADDPQLRWLGPHKGVVHFALASLTNACFDIWAMVKRPRRWGLRLVIT
jgi:L-fuconate dehydratase